MHLTNNSIAKHSDKFYSQAKYINNMMSMQEFANYITVYLFFFFFFKKKVNLRTKPLFQPNPKTNENASNLFLEICARDHPKSKQFLRALRL